MSETIEQTAIVVLPATAISTIVAADKDDILGNLAAKIAAFKPDISTPKGRDAIRSLAADVASSKMDLIRLGKSLTEGWRKSTSAVNAECKVIEEKMDALKTQVRGPLTAWEQKEKDRVAAHEAALKAISDLFITLPSDATVADMIERLRMLRPAAERQWEEFEHRAAAEVHGTATALKNAIRSAKQREEEAAELARLRAEEAERERLRLAQEQADREARIAAEAAERARMEAVAEAARQAAEVAAAAERSRLAAEAKAARVLRETEERAAAEKTAVERKAREEAEAAARERDRIAMEAREAEEAAACREREAVEREEAQKRRAEAAEMAAQAARDQAERDAAAAVERERQRVAEIQAAEAKAAAAREADKAHRASVNREAMADLVAAGLDDKAARAAVTAIARGGVRHVRVTY